MKNIFLLAIVFVTASCASTTNITSSWKAPDITSASLSMKKIMVAALLPGNDRQLQQSMENQLVKELKLKGIDAASALETYGPKYLPDNEQKAIAKLQQDGIDGFLTIVLLDKKKQKTYNPGYSQFGPYGYGYYRNWYGYYTTIYGRVYAPDYYTTVNKYYWESNLYNMPGQKLIYSEQSQSFDPASISQLADSYSDQLVNDMAKKGLIVKK